MYNDFNFSHAITDNFLAQHALAHESTYKDLHVVMYMLPYISSLVGQVYV